MPLPNVPLPNLIVESKEVPGLLRLLESFFTSGGLNRKLDEVDRALRSSPPILREFWTVPNNAVWLGLRELRKAAASKVNAVSDLRAIIGVLPTLELAARLRHILPSAPSWKRDELRTRLLSKGSIAPVMMEIDAAAHCLLRGFSIHWVESKSKQGLRTPEMVVTWPDGKFEIECKSQSIDAGRKIPRRAFYEICDKVMSRLTQLPLTGIEREIQIVLPDRFAVNVTSQNDLCDAVMRARHGGSESLPKGGEINVKCRVGNPISFKDAQKRLRQKAGSFGHGLVSFGDETVLISCRSMQSDHIVKAIESNLSDAFRQLSCTIPAQIMCYVPEVHIVRDAQDGQFSSGDD